MQSRLAQAKDSAAGFDPLEFDRFTRVQELTRMMAESVNDVATVQRNLQRTVEATEDDLIAQARQTRELQRDLLRTRMVEFEGISDRLYRVVRQASKETGKQVQAGHHRRLHRNGPRRAGPHDAGLRAPAAQLRGARHRGRRRSRTAAGKDASGTILIDLHQEGNDVSVEFRDDGAGLNLPRIREKARAAGPDRRRPAARRRRRRQPDLHAGLLHRGAGDRAVRPRHRHGRGALRGQRARRPHRDQHAGRPGTSFKLVLPLTTAVTQVVMMRTGSARHRRARQPGGTGAPRAAPRKSSRPTTAARFDFGGEQVPFFWSGALLQSSPRSTEPQGKTLPVVVFRSAAQRVAVHVDEVLGNQEVVVKNLGPQLARLPGLAGMTVLASGAVVLIYNPVALSAVYGEQARLLSADHAQPEVLEGAGSRLPAAPQAPVAPQVPLVLVVDDSITVRRVTQRLLQREGYRVALAADGLQALERLAEERPAVVLSDIEMPRMDGFDLARNIRADARWPTCRSS